MKKEIFEFILAILKSIKKLKCWICCCNSNCSIEKNTINNCDEKRNVRQTSEV